MGFSRIFFKERKGHEHYLEVPKANHHFRRFVARYAQLDLYIFSNPDVELAGIEPLEHIISCGIAEGRRIPGIRRVSISSPIQAGTECIRFGTGEEEFLLVPEVTVAAGVLSKLESFLPIEPSVGAAGADALGTLPCFEASDLKARSGIDPWHLVTQISERPKHVVLMPALQIGGAEKFALNLAETLSFLERQPTLVIMTEQIEKAGYRPTSCLPVSSTCNFLNWTELGEGAHNPRTLLAHLLSAMKPSTITVVNSRLGLQIVEEYGRALGSLSDLFVTYFSLAPRAIGAPYAAFMPRKTAPFSTTLTDNNRMKYQLEEKLPEELLGSIVVLPPLVKERGEIDFDHRLSGLLAGRKHRRSGRNWVWMGRLTQAKGIDILKELAQFRSEDKFHVYGPLEEPTVLRDLEHLENIIIHAPVAKIEQAITVTTDGFVFTSYYEGMPNVVLEAVEAGIPVISTDVGGLRDSFSEESLGLISLKPTAKETAFELAAEMAVLVQMSNDEIEVRLRLARKSLLARHSWKAFHENVEAVYWRTERV